MSRESPSQGVQKTHVGDRDRRPKIAFEGRHKVFVSHLSYFPSVQSILDGVAPFLIGFPQYLLRGLLRMPQIH